MRHYVFDNRVVHGPLVWKELTTYPKGSYGYTPTDMESTKWFRLSGDSLVWASLNSDEVPAAFKVQLLLLGVPL